MISKKQPCDSENNELHEQEEEQFQNIIGLGEFSARKSYYPELQKKVDELEDEKEKLKVTKSLLDNIINSMPSAIIAIDSAGLITQVNKSALHFTMVDDKDIIANDTYSVFPQFSEIFDEILIYSKPEETIIKSNISVWWNDKRMIFDFISSPLESDRNNGLVIRIDDVTEKMRMEQMVVQTEKMMSVGGLAAGMAHEINNPLAAIIQGIQNIVRRLDPTEQKNIDAAKLFDIDLVNLHNFLSERKIFRFLEGGREAGMKAAKIVKNMLLFSRTNDFSHTPVDLVTLIEHTTELGSTDYDMKRKYDFKFVDIIKEYDPQMPSVNCCPGEIEQVMLNLFKNSLQAMELNDKSIRPQFCIRLIKEDKFARIEIKDNGPGIPKDVQKRIFEPFFTTKPIGTGTGLGLSVSYMIITQKHGGTFEVESDIGHGATFIIRLPL